MRLYLLGRMETADTLVMWQAVERHGIGNKACWEQSLLQDIICIKESGSNMNGVHSASF